MNINLSGSKKQGGKAGKSLGFGLNKRKKPAKSNVFDDDDESGEDEPDAPNDDKKARRDAVNREIAAEQEALRKRAKKAMAGAASDTLYDYDGAYESFQPNKEADKSQEAPKEKKSRYIQDLLKQSEKRNIEREAIYERKVAREQEEEDAQLDFRGKEKFVTKGTMILGIGNCIVVC